MKKIIIAFVAIVLYTNAFAVNEIVVAKDGTGDFTTIQDALNSIPANNAEWKTIIVKNGIYDEHVMIKTSYIALVGESRSATRIEHNLPRAVWYAANGVNTGTGVINIAGNMHDIVIANMRVRNTFEGSEDYTEVIRTETGSTKLWFVNLDVLCLWKDTFAPWGKAGGMYYVADCAFRGSIDAFCPRGYCYAINCRFTETKSSSPIWHEGVAGEDQKLVIQGGSVHSEYNKNVKLQNSQNYAKFYYLDLQLSDSITALGSGATAYFYGVKGLAGLTWFNNNLTLANRKAIDAVWTYDGKWEPENVMPAVLPFAALPQPYNGRYAVSVGVTTLKWIPARNALSHKVYFGTTEQTDLLVETTNNFVQSPSLATNTTYYWKVNTITTDGEIQGQKWRFTTSDAIDPVTQATLVLNGNNNQTIILGNNMTPVSYILSGATQYTVTGLPDGVTALLNAGVITISGKPTTKGTYNYTVETTDAISNAKAMGVLVVKEEGEVVPDPPTDTDYTSTRLATYTTTLDCKTMPQEPAWIVKGSSVSWAAGTGYKWGSSSAIMTVKVTNCSKVECTFTNTSTSRPVIISDGGASNDVTTYPTAANAETMTTFIPKTTGSNDITIKTSGSSGMSVTKLVLYGMSNVIQKVVVTDWFNFSIINGELASSEPLDIFDITGKIIAQKVKKVVLQKGFYIIRCKSKSVKIIVQ